MLCYLCVWLHFFFFCIPAFYVQLPACHICCNGFGHRILAFFLCQNAHFFVFCLKFSVPLPRCFVFLAAQFASFCALGYFWVLCHANVFFLRCCSFFCCLFFAHLCDCFFFFLQFVAFVDIFVYTCFAVSFGLPVCFLDFSLR